MKLPAAVVLALFFAAGCQASANGGAVEQTATNQCPGDPTVLVGTALPGTHCSSYLDCAPACCPCPNNDGDEYLASECFQGTCSDVSGACTDEEGAATCP